MRVEEIGNLSGLIGAMCAEEGVVFPSGDRLEFIRIREDEGVLKQARQVRDIGKGCGMSTENGIWLFFRDAIMFSFIPICRRATAAYTEFVLKIMQRLAHALTATSLT